MTRSSPMVTSPCIGVCRMHAESGWCEGCLRTLDEIAAWGNLGDADRLRVMRSLPARRVQWRLRRVAVAAPGTTPATDTP
jgi:uncharacterized protein